jgi:hypothetical protein
MRNIFASTYRGYTISPLLRGGWRIVKDGNPASNKAKTR